MKKEGAEFSFRLEWVECPFCDRLIDASESGETGSQCGCGAKMDISIRVEMWIEPKDFKIDPEVTGLDDPRLRDRSTKVVIDREGKRRVLFLGSEVKAGDLFICQRPHDDGRFDYLCGGSFCRCCS